MSLLKPATMEVTDWQDVIGTVAAGFQTVQLLSGVQVIHFKLWSSVSLTWFQPLVSLRQSRGPLGVSEIFGNASFS